MVISHDRFFLDRICTHLLIMEGNGQTRWYEGNFTAYEKSVMAENPERLAHRRNKYHVWCCGDCGSQSDSPANE